MLQELLTKAAGVAETAREGVFCPGVYVLDQPLRPPSPSRASRSTAAAARRSAAQRANPAAFLDGLIVLTGCDGATIHGLRFEPQPVPVVDTFRCEASMRAAWGMALAKMAPMRSRRSPFRRSDAAT